MRNTWKFHSAGSVVFGNGSIVKLPKIIESFKADKVAVICDQGIKAAGLLDKIASILEAGNINYYLYDQAIPEPTVSSMMSCVSKVKEYEPDLLVAVGGGSSIDLTKLTSLLLTHGGHPSDYYGEGKVPGSIKPYIAIPTTAGTGSEVSPVAIVTDEETGLKNGISDNLLRSSVALLDPELTIKLPPYITACTGIDALSQAIEAYFATDFRYVQANGELIYQGSNPMSDHLAEKAIELIGKGLVPAVNQGGSIEARSNMLLGNLFSALAFTNSGTSLIHALAYPIAKKSKKPHGEIIGVLLPYIMKYNAPVNPEKFSRIADLLGVTTANMTASEKVDKSVDAIFSILKNIGLPTRLADIGIKKEDLVEIVSTSLSIERLIRLNPKTPSEDTLIELLHTAI